MAATYWHKQTPSSPLFPDLLWSRPENKRLAGKLLIIGGSASGFATPAESYNQALKAGVGAAKVLLPNSLEKTVGQVFPEAEFASSNPSGSFAATALAEWQAASQWADGVLLAGDLGKNSETAIVLEKFTDKYTGQLTLAGDSLDYFLAQPGAILARAGIVLVPSFSQLQKLAASQGLAITSQLDLLQLVERLHDLTDQISAALIASTNDQIIVAASGQVSTLPSSGVPVSKLAATAAVWQLQNPDRIFAALATAAATL